MASLPHRASGLACQHYRSRQPCLADEACVMFRTVAAATALWAVFLCAPAEPGEKI